MPDLPMLLQLGQAIAAAVLASSYGIIRRRFHNEYVSAGTIGVLFGTVAIISMFTPITISDGVIVDLRNLFIGISFAYFGWFGGLTTLFMAVTARLMIGGSGTESGIAAMALAGGCGYAWRLWLRPHLPNVTLSHVVLGVMIALSLAGALLAPEPYRSDIILGLGPTLLLFYVLGSLVLAGMLAREMALIEQANSLLKAAHTDPLTNLPNRRGMQDILSGYSPGAEQTRGMAMLCFDIDRFKQINDTHGHMVGDEVLREVTNRVNRCLRAQDHLARHGGDEFVVFQADLTNAQALLVAERCRLAVSTAPIQVGSVAIDVTISVGAHWVPKFADFDSLYSRADKALYAAKEEGRNLVRLFAEAA